MNIKMKKCDFNKIKDKMMDSLNEQNSLFDSFLEDHILKSVHYEILNDSEQVGYFSIFNESLLTQFYLDKNFRYCSQEIFDKVRRYEEVQKAFVSTGDEFFLTHIIDYSKDIQPQAYFFKDIRVEICEDKVLNNFICRVAEQQDIELIKEKADDFFDDVFKQVQEKQIYIGYINEEIVSFGVIEKSKIYSNVASIGIYTVSDKRQCGIGRNTLIQLKEICYKEDIVPIAGCWYYNHNSKRTLQSAGMIPQSRLLVAKL